jgi:hypothetical protein
MTASEWLACADWMATMHLLTGKGSARQFRWPCFIPMPGPRHGACSWRPLDAVPPERED